MNKQTVFDIRKEQGILYDHWQIYLPCMSEFAKLAIIKDTLYFNQFPQYENIYLKTSDYAILTYSRINNRS